MDIEIPRTYNLPYGVELHQLQVWKDADGTVIIQAPAGVSQVTFTPDQWERLKAFIDTPIPGEEA